jgi:hypothetical protein
MSSQYRGSILQKSHNAAAPHVLVRFAIEVIRGAAGDCLGKTGAAGRLEKRQVVQFVILIVDDDVSGGVASGSQPRSYFITAGLMLHVRQDVNKRDAEMLCMRADLSNHISKSKKERPLRQWSRRASIVLPVASGRQCTETCADCAFVGN